MRTVHELNPNELEELRFSYFYQLQETNEDVLDDITKPEEIPMDDIIEHYEGIYFTEDDFFCNRY